MFELKKLLRLLISRHALFLLIIVLSQSIAFGGRLDIWKTNSYPTRLALGPNGNVYVTDYRAHSVFIYDSDLTLIGELKDPSRPLGITVDRRGRIYVGDDERNVIDVFDQEGQPIRTFGQGVIQKPTDIAVDLEDNVYVADVEANTVLVFSPSGQYHGNIGPPGNGLGQLLTPLSVAVAYFNETNGQETAELYVGDQGNGRIQVFDRGGHYLRNFGGKPEGGSQFSQTDWHGKYAVVQSIQVDDQCNLHVLDNMMHKIQVVDRFDGTMLSEYGDYGTTPGKLNLPLDIAIRPDGSVLVANAGNGKIEIVGSNAVSIVSLPSNTITENSPAGTLVGNFLITPDTGGSNTYALVPGQGDDHNSLFQIIGSNLLTATELNFEILQTCLIRVKGSNTNSLNTSLASQLTVTVLDTNDTPTGIELDNIYIAETAPSNSLVGHLAAIDEDSADTFSYWFTNGVGDTGNSAFSISGSNLLTDSLLDYDTTNFYSLRVVAADSGGETTTGILAVSVVNIVESGDWDRDGDGIADWWEYEYTGDNTNQNPIADDDGDGYINLYEWIASTDPLDKHDKFEVQTPDPTSPLRTLRWNSFTNRLYSIEWTTNFTTGFGTIATNIDATPPENVYTDMLHSAESFGYYKIKVQLKP